MSPVHDFVWSRLHLPVPLDSSAATAALTSLATVPGDPLVVLEASASGGQVSWRLGAQRNAHHRVVGALSAFLGDLRPEPARRPAARSDQSSEVAGAIRIGGRLPRSLDVDATETTTRGLLQVLASTCQGEQLRIQLMLGPRLRPRAVPDPQALPTSSRRAATAKAAEHRFRCEVRLSANAVTPERTRSLVSQAVGALRAMESPDARLRLVRASHRSMDGTRMPWIWRTTVSVSEAPAFTGWPIAAANAAPLPGVPPMHPRLLPVDRRQLQTGRVLGNSILNPERPVALSTGDSLKHLHILGPNGVGKSTLMANLALGDIEAGHGVIVIDPKGDLVNVLLARIPEHRRRDVVVLDPTDTAPFGIDCFAGDPELASDALLGVFHSLYEKSWGPRTSDILHGSLLSLARRAEILRRTGEDSGVSLVMVPLLLTNPGFRRSVTSRVIREDPLGLGSFWATFESWSDAERSQAIQPLMNKLRQVLLRPGLRAVFGQRRPKFAMRDVFTPTASGKGRILLVSLAEGALGPEASMLLGSITVGLLWQAALGRTQVPEHHRHPVLLHIDEMQKYVRLGDVGDALARARGLGLGMTLAHQAMGQLSPALAEAVKANARSKIAFQLSPTDAQTYARMSIGQLEAIDFQTLPAFTAYASLMAGNTQMPWCSIQTTPLPNVKHPERRIASLRAASRANFGQPLDEIERELLALTEPTNSYASRGQDGARFGRARPGQTSTGEPS